MGPVVKTLPSNGGDTGLIPGCEGKIPHYSWPKKQNIKKQRQYCNKFNTDLFLSPYQKKAMLKKRIDGTR